MTFVAGQRLTATDLNAATQAATWGTYSPSWTSNGSAPSIGNGTLSGFYVKTGRTVTANINIWGGSTTNWGTGAYNLSLPFTASTTGVPLNGLVATGALSAQVAGTPTFYALTAVIYQNTPGLINAFADPGSGSFWSQTNPAVFGTTSSVVATITYQSVS